MDYIFVSPNNLGQNAFYEESFDGGIVNTAEVKACFSKSGSIAFINYCRPPQVTYTTNSFLTPTSDLGGFARLQNSLSSSNPGSPSRPGITTYIVNVTIVATVIFLGSRFWRSCHK